MVKAVLSAVGFWMSFGAMGQATRYMAIPTQPYQTVENFTNCVEGPCQSFSLTQEVSGWIQTKAPLAAKLPFPTSISPDVAAFRLFDGITTYESSDPQVRVQGMFVSTDDTGKLDKFLITVSRWQTPGASHAMGDRLASVRMSNLNTMVSFYNAPCGEEPGVGAAGQTDTCRLLAASGEPSTSTASEASVKWVPESPSPSPVPTLSQWAVMLLAGGLGVLGAMLARKRFSQNG